MPKIFIRKRAMIQIISFVRKKKHFILLNLFDTRYEINKHESFMLWHKSSELKCDSTREILLQYEPIKKNILFSWIFTLLLNIQDRLSIKNRRAMSNEQ
jgi:hypothetical protein